MQEVGLARSACVAASNDRRGKGLTWKSPLDMKHYHTRGEQIMPNDYMEKR
jgi:hypothetical protein